MAAERPIPYTGPVDAEYRLRCQYPNCVGELLEYRLETEGWRLGMLIHADPTNPAIAKCPICKRYQMMVVAVPEPRPIQEPEGFWRIPTT